MSTCPECGSRYVSVPDFLGIASCLNCGHNFRPLQLDDDERPS